MRAAFVEPREDVVIAQAFAVGIDIDHRAVDLEHGDHLLGVGIDHQRMRLARRLVDVSPFRRDPVMLEVAPLPLQHIAMDQIATGAAAEDGQARVMSVEDPRLDAFRLALNDLLKDLALQVVRDGEGARKMVEITVKGAESDQAARTIAMSIANSPLVKTAVAGEDANWGRIVMAVGKSGEMADRDRLAIWFGDIRVAVNGERDPAYSEA
eukprot:gene66817-91497_t